jgi:proteasome assembly chaperone (PAC2) family protein
MCQTASPDLVSFQQLKAFDVFGEHLHQMVHLVPKEAIELLCWLIYLHLKLPNQIDFIVNRGEFQGLQNILKWVCNGL